MLIFSNKGEIDPRLIQLIGVNVKENSSPVGFFGTGLKYAIASILRWEGKATIQSGRAEFTFSLESSSIRGKSFDLISMNGRYDRQILGFTTELGKNWKPWMVYRELYCNAFDEPEGEVLAVQAAARPCEGVTRVIVECAELEEAHERRWDFLLSPDRERVERLANLEICEGESSRIFYRGIAVRELDKKKTLFTYNILNKISLTEDRTASQWETEYEITRALAELADEEMIERILLAPPEYSESQFNWEYVLMEGAFQRVAERLARERARDVPASIRRTFEPKENKCPHCGRPY